MPSPGQDLQVILQAQEKRDLAPNVTSQVIGEIKSSLIFQYNWEELLQSAPTAISCMGACFVAASSEKATVTLTPPAEKGFQYLRYSSVQANLVECGNLGRYAFLEAENGMGIIQLTSKVINGKINDIVGSLADPPSAKKLLRPQLDSLRQGARQCYTVAVAMDKKFEDWLFYVCEMHAACVQQEVTTRETLLSNEICLAAEQTRLDYQKEATEEAKKTTELMGKQVGLASEAFKKASDEFPTGWDIMGQQIVGDLANCVTSALNAAIPALIDNLNPISKLKAGAGVVGSFVHPDKDSPPAANGNNGAAVAPTQNSPPSAVPKQLVDPAYAEIQKINAYLAALQVIVNGRDTDGNIDWEKARAGSGGKAGASSSIKFVSTMLADAKARFSPVATAAEPSVKLATILDVTSRIASEIEAEVKKAKDITTSFPAKDSEQVKKWQSDFAAQYREANTLLATAKTIPGTAANGIPLMAQDPAVQTAQINAKTAQAQAVLESAKNRLSTTQQMLTTAQENYVKTTDMLLQQQNKLGEIQANLSKLTASNISLAEIKRILIECIKLIINLKQQISNLVRFFKAIAAIIDVCVKYHVEPFLETVKAIVAADGTDPYKELKIGDFTLTDFQRSQVFSATVTLRSYFSVFGDIAKMWVDLSRDNVMPGLKMCDELSVTVGEGDAGQMKKRVAMLDKWSKEAADRVAQVARSKQEEILSGMESRIQEVKETTQRIEPPPTSALQAITAGTEVTKVAAQKSIEARATQSPLSRFAIIED